MKNLTLFGRLVVWLVVQTTCALVALAIAGGMGVSLTFGEAHALTSPAVIITILGLAFIEWRGRKK